jgi:AraC family transcriptional regulator
MKSRDLSLGEYRARLARALAYVQENLAEEVSLEGAAATACFSKYHFHRIFTALVGESFADYVRRLRLERAAILLQTRPALGITEVALASGFSSPSVFSRDFSARFGSPPSVWREGRGGRTEEPRASGRPWLDEASRGRSLGDALAPGCEGLEVRQLGPFHFASIMSTNGYGRAIEEAWGRLYRWAGPRGILGQGGLSGLAAGLAWDSPGITAPERCRYSVCLPCPLGLEASGGVVFLDFPRRSYLVLSYKGPDLSAAYDALYGKALPESGFEPEDAPALEFYRSVAQPLVVFDLDLALPVRAL